MVSESNHLNLQPIDKAIGLLPSTKNMVFMVRKNQTFYLDKTFYDPGIFYAEWVSVCVPTQFYNCILLLYTNCVFRRYFF